MKLEGGILCVCVCVWGGGVWGGDIFFNQIYSDNHIPANTKHFSNISVKVYLG